MSKVIIIAGFYYNENTPKSFGLIDASMLDSSLGIISITHHQIIRNIHCIHITVSFHITYH